MTYKLSDLKIPHLHCDVGGIIFVTLELNARYNLRRTLSEQEKQSVVNFLQANASLEDDLVSREMLFSLVRSVRRDF